MLDFMNLQAIVENHQKTNEAEANDEWREAGSLTAKRRWSAKRAKFFNGKVIYYSD